MIKEEVQSRDGLATPVSLKTEDDGFDGEGGLADGRFRRIVWQMPCAVAFLADEQGGQDVVLPIVLHGGGGSIPREEGAGRPVDGFNWGFLPVCEPRLLTERRKAFHAIRRRRQFRRECLIWLKSFEKRILQLDLSFPFCVRRRASSRQRRAAGGQFVMVGG